MASKGLDQYVAAAQGTPNPAMADNSAEGGQLLALLGEANLTRFKEYSDELPARTALKLLDGQLGGDPLSAAQSARLIQIIKAEPADLTRGIMGAPDRAFLGSQAEIDSFLQQVAASNQRIVRQAGSVLTRDQLAALDDVLTKAIETRRLQAAALIQQH